MCKYVISVTRKHVPFIWKFTNVLSSANIPMLSLPILFFCLTKPVTARPLATCFKNQYPLLIIFATRLEAIEQVNDYCLKTELLNWVTLVRDCWLFTMSSLSLSCLLQLWCCTT